MLATFLQKMPRAKFLLPLFLVVIGVTVVVYTHKSSTGESDIRSSVYGTTAPGDIYTTFVNLHEFDETSPVAQASTILMDANGKVKWSRKEDQSTLDFKEIGEGLYVLTRFLNSTGRWDGQYELLDKDFRTQRTIKAIGLEHTDIHGITFLKNGNMIIPSYELKQTSEGAVEEYVLQEVTPSGEVVFQWRSLDHVPVSENVYKESRPYWKENNIDDYFHGNSVFELPDGNLLVSSRHTSQILNIDRKTGEIVWRFGGRLSDFSIENDPYNGFSFQHSVHMLSNGNILLYDNGNLHMPQQTRVVEYALDMKHRVAKLVWSYQIPGKFTYAAGSVQRLSNGNTFIGWGMEKVAPTSSVRISEIDPQGKPVLEVSFPGSFGMYSAYKFE